MATYAQILKSESQGRRQRWFIWGKEPALVQDAYELAVEHVATANLNVEKQVFLGKETTLFELECALNQYFDAERLLIVLLDAEHFEAWDELLLTLKDLDSSRFFIAVGSEEPSESTRKGFMGSNKVRYVVCNKMDAEDLRSWVESRVNIQYEATKYLLQRTHGDYAWLLNQIRKLELVNVPEINLKLVQLLCPSQGLPDFSASLLNQRKRAALVSVEKSTPSNKDLDSLVVLLRKYLVISESVRHVGVSPRMLTERTGLSPKDISDLRKMAVHYDKSTATRCLAALVKLYVELGRSNPLAYYSLIFRW